jgi:hypothetical protein
MEDFLVHTKTEREAFIIAEIFDKMKISYERRSNSDIEQGAFDYSDELKAQLDQVEADVINGRTDKFISEDELHHRIFELLKK